MPHHLELNEVDLIVKSLMLANPTIFPSRFRVLTHLFLTNGNGWDWRDGRLMPWNAEGSDEQNRMQYDDLIERRKENDADLAEASDYMRPLYLSRKAAIEREFVVRKLIEQDIDLYACNHVMGEDIQYNAQWLLHNSPEWCALSIDNPFGTNFPKEMHPDWASAAEEIVRIARDALWRDIGMPNSERESENADPRKLVKYRGYNQILERLDQFTHWKAREDEAMEFINELAHKARERERE